MGYQDSIGRTQTQQDEVSSRLVRGLAASLDLPVPTILPPLWHWMLFQDWVPGAGLGPDGHPRRGGFLPPVHDLPRRMWAGGRVTFHRSLQVGDAVSRTSTILDVTEKQGGSGRLVFVTVGHRIDGPDGLAIEEEQDIVYRGAAGAAVKPAPAAPDAPEGAIEATVMPNPVLLFRYSALTGNGHRIHYDMDYVRHAEGYPGLIVHGPLQATWLAGLLTGRPVARFAFRGRRPAFHGAALRLQGWPDPAQWRLRSLDTEVPCAWRRRRPWPMASFAAAPHALRDNPADAVRGILIVACAYFVMTMGDVAGKWVLVPAGIATVMFGRGLAGAATIAGLAAIEGDWRRLMPVRWRLVLFRSVLHATQSLTWYVAWLYISLADSYALGFTAPLVMTLLAIPMLGERIRWRRAVSTAVGFCGVLLMVRPGSELWRPELLIMVPGIMGMAVSRIMTRTLSTTETAECLTFWLMVAHVPVGLLLLAAGLPGPRALTLGVVMALVLLGALNGSAHWLMARAYALAPVSALAPYEYTMLIWGGIAGFLVFSEVPGGGTVAGAGVVAAAGLYNLHRERLRRGEATRKALSIA